MRLPGKLLREVAGKPLILHTLERARSARSVSRAIVATDDESIHNLVVAAGGEAKMTSVSHRSGSDRIAEVANGLPSGSVIVNVQGDEPLISPETIDRAVEAMLARDEHDPSAPDIVTVWEPFEDAREIVDGNNVKVVVGADGYALYFSRSPIPWPRDESLRYGGDATRAIESEPELLSTFRKHAGLYVYTREYLLAYTNMEPTPLERIEMLEQLRALENGARIKVVEAAGRSVGVDTEEDLEKVRRILEEAVLAA